MIVDMSGKGCDVKMSLVMAIANKEGIVITADRRLTETHFYKDYESIVTYKNHYRKLFVTNRGHAIASTGTAIFQDGTPVKDIICKAIETLNSKPLSIDEEFRFLKRGLIKHSEPNDNVVLVMAGIENNQNVVMIENVKTSKFRNRVQGQDAFVSAGDNKLVSSMYSFSNIDLSQFSVEQTVQYLEFINETTARLQKFSQNPQTVSEQCDILVIQKNRIYWKNEPFAFEDDL